MNKSKSKVSDYEYKIAKKYMKELKVTPYTNKIYFPFG